MTRPAPSIVRMFVLLTLALVLAPNPVPGAQAAHSAVGVSPATLDFTDPPLLAGGSKVGFLTFQQHYDRPVEVQIDAIPYGGPAGDATSWLRLSSQGTIVLTPGSHQIDVHVDVPASTANGHYAAGVRFMVQPPDGRDFEGSGATAQAAVTSIIKIAVANENQVKRIEAEPKVLIDPVEVDGSLQVTLTLTNTGNVDANPHVRLDVFDQMKARVLQSTWFNETILRPGESEPVTFAIPGHGLPEGQYWASVLVALDGATIHTSGHKEFHVLEKGALLRSLQLKTIQIENNMTRVAPGKMLKLTALVLNTGQIAATGQFLGEVRRNGELIEALESRPLEIAIGETGQMHMLYTPKEPGSHEFVGSVQYGSKITEEKSVLVAVDEEEGQSPVLLLLGAVGLLACGVGAAAVRTRFRK